jgi:hypothetical protein
VSADPHDPNLDGEHHPGAHSASLSTRRLCELCVELLPIDGAAIAVMGSQEARELVYSTNSVAQELDELQFVLGEGPCLDAFDIREAVLITDLASEAARQRWPGFAAEAIEAGVRAAFAFPLQAGPIRFGVLELYRSTPGELDAAALTSALMIVEHAVHVVLSDMTTELASAAATGSPRESERADIHRATGMIAAQLSISIPEALSRLRAAAFAAQRPLLDVYREVLARTRTFKKDTSS